VASNDTRSRRPHDTTPLLEWILGSLGVVLFVGAVGFLLFEGSQGQERPAGVEIRVDEIIPTEDAYIVRYRAHNTGTQTLVDVRITASLYDGTQELERAEATLDFLPGQSWRRGGFFLREDPRKHRLELRVGGYQEP
jgi:uncharacterized protein (TIGR02588 family)